MKKLFMICLVLFICIFVGNGKKIKQRTHFVNKDSVNIEIIKPIVVFDSTKTYKINPLNSFQTHTYYYGNYEIIFDNLYSEKIEPNYLLNSFEIKKDNILKIKKYSFFLENNKVFEKEKLKIIRYSKRISRKDKAYEIKSKELMNAAFYLEKIGDIFKTGVPYVIINSNYDGGNAGGSHLLIFELSDTVRMALDIYPLWAQCVIKDIDNDSIPEIKYLVRFEYTKDDMVLADTYTIDIILKFIGGNFYLYTEKMKKKAPTVKQLNDFLKDISIDYHYGDREHIFKRNLFYKMVELAYFGNRDVAYKLLTRASKIYKINVTKYKKYFDKKMEEYKKTAFYVDF